MKGFYVRNLIRNWKLKKERPFIGHGHIRGLDPLNPNFVYKYYQWAFAKIRKVLRYSLSRYHRKTTWSRFKWRFLPMLSQVFDFLRLLGHLLQLFPKFKQQYSLIRSCKFDLLKYGELLRICTFCDKFVLQSKVDIQRQPPEVFCGKRCLPWRPATLLKRDSNTIVFL